MPIASAPRLLGTVTRLGRLLALAVCLSAGPVVIAGDAHAQVGQGRAPWCADMLNGIAECHYYSFEQCMARASGISNSCFVNPYFVPPPQVARPPKRGAPRKAD